MTMTTQSITSITDGQQYQRFVGDVLTRALQELGFDLKEFGLDDEEVGSSYGYMSYYRPKGIAEQITRLKELFPELGNADAERADQPLPPNAEGWFAIPRWEKISRTYNEAVEKVLAMIKQTHNGRFYNYREGKLGPNCLHQHERTVEMLKELDDQQAGHSILIVPAQFGFRHRGRSVRRACEVFNASEFGLGAFAVAVCLLTHPKRLQHCFDLGIHCAGDEYDNLNNHDRFSHAPFFRFRGGEVEFDVYRFDRANGRYGSASGFVSQ
jgi:hypothetical protein